MISRIKLCLTSVIYDQYIVLISLLYCFLASLGYIISLQVSRLTTRVIPLRDGSLVSGFDRLIELIQRGVNFNNCQ